MRSFILSFIGLFLTGGLVVALSSSVQDDLHWRWSTFGDQATDYAAYLDAFPAGHHAAEARDSLDVRSWEAAAHADTRDAYTAYMQSFPAGRYAEAAAAHVETIDWQAATRQSTVIAIQGFLTSYPDGRYAEKAAEIVERLRRSDAPFQAAQEQGTRAAYERFLTDFPGHQHEPAARNALADMEGRPLVDLMAEGKVEAETQGSGIRSTSLRLRRLVDHEVSVIIPVGTFFVSRNASSQNMVSTRPEVVALRSDGWTSVSVPAACANLPRAIPGGEDRFTIRSAPNQAELRRLMPVLQRAGASEDVVQAAVWIVTDDADYGDLGSLVSRSSYQVYGGTRVIDQKEAARAMKLCAEAGIDIRRKSIWRDRQQIAQGLEDETLRRWLRQ